jgi:hypothetical protein
MREQPGTRNSITPLLGTIIALALMKPIAMKASYAGKEKSCRR